MLEESVVLEDEPDATALRGQRRRVVVVEKNSSLSRNFKACDDAQQGRLAGSGRPEQRNELAVFDGETGAAQSTGPAEVLGDIDEADAHA